MSIAHAHPINIKDLGAELARYRSSLPASAKSGLRIRANDNRLSLTVAKNSGLRVVVDPHVASFEGKKLPRFSVEVQDFQTTTEGLQTVLDSCLLQKRSNGASQSERDHP